MQVPEVWAACLDWRVHGHKQLCAGGYPGGNGPHLWQHMPWRRQGHEQSPVKEDTQLQRGVQPSQAAPLLCFIKALLVAV